MACEVRSVRNGLIVVGALVAGTLWALTSVPGVAAQNPIERTEPAAGAVLESPPSTVEVWLQEPLSTGAKADLQVVQSQSGARVDMAAASLDESDPTHLKVPLPRDLGSGRYVVSWAILSGGYVTEGSFSFTLVSPSPQDNDDRVTIALGTFGAAAAAVVVGLLGYLLRLRLGLVKPPPPPEERHGSH
jgi:methionine-rich copper-binding protein CopC